MNYNFIHCLRFIAVILVYTSHVLISFWVYNPDKQKNFNIIPVDFHSEIFNTIISLIPHEINFGPLGVALFFLITGFLFGLKIDTQEKLSAALLKRMFRILPIYWFSMFIFTITIILFSNNYIKFSLSEILINFTGVPNSLGKPSIMGLNWYIEAILYFFLYSIIFNYFFPLIKFENIVLFIACLLIFKCSYYRTYYLYIILGINFANFYFKRYTVKHFITICLLSSACFYYLYTYKGVSRITLYNYLIAFLLFCFFYFVQNKKWMSNFAKNKCIVFINKLSYPIYLLQIISFYIIPVIYIYIKSWWLCNIINLGIILILSYIGHRFIEIPCIHFIKARTTQ